MRIEDLATTTGADRLRLALGLDKDQVAKIKTLASSMSGANPHIKDTYIGKSAPNVSFYDFKNNRLGIGHASSDVLAHEMGHAASLANSSELYKDILRGSKALSRLSNLASLPVASFISLNPKLTPAQKTSLLDKATLASALVASPNILEELNASARAIYHSPTTFRTAASMIPGIVSHTFNDFTAPSTYYLANKILRSTTND
tara:strand:+ start:122 stop:730 length:609 start_codon:yes stop_codon:yes gene_type:complete